MPRTRDENEELLADLLADLEKYSGVPLEDIMASQFETGPERQLPEGFEAESIEEPLGIESELHMAEDFSLENDTGDDFGDYLDDLYEDVDVDPGDEDAYADEPV